ncbi:uncharacterized protein LOC123680536 [Harmonia axyridis]|uniref:uncharacterized protein LOC123680536 n=1 Tax=Harmonia axyridis TaxID=115357 RepID=UPI001E276FDF|nr:uncharacterized protein LOC123680536 [Harmonia axyridis]
MSKILVVLTLFFFISNSIARSVRKEIKNENKEHYYNPGDFDVIYDQKQNASENYRLDISGVDVVIVHPSSILETILSPLSALAFLDDFSKKASPLTLRKHSSVKKGNKYRKNSNGPALTSSSTEKLNEVTDIPTTPSKNLIKNLEEKIQVKELLPTSTKKVEIVDSTKSFTDGKN